MRLNESVLSSWPPWKGDKVIFEPLNEPVGETAEAAALVESFNIQALDFPVNKHCSTMISIIDFFKSLGIPVLVGLLALLFGMQSKLEV